MTIKYNSPGANFTSLKNAWNENKFMKEYEQVNNPYFPFVYGNPDGYGSNTNPDPFFWGQPQAPKYCACGTSLKLAQAGEGYCSSCNGDATYKDNSPSVSSHSSLPPLLSESPSKEVDWNDESTSQSHNEIHNKTIKTLEHSLDDVNPIQITPRGHDQQLKQLRTLQSIGAASLPANCRRNPNSPGCMSEFYTPQLPYNSISQYGRGSIGNGTITNAPVVPVSYYTDEQYSQPNQPNQSPVMIGQYPPVKITSMGGIDYSHTSPVNVSSNWSTQQRKDFCSSTRGGKKLAF